MSSKEPIRDNNPDHAALARKKCPALPAIK